MADRTVWTGCAATLDADRPGDQTRAEKEGRAFTVAIEFGKDRAQHQGRAERAGHLLHRTAVEIPHPDADHETMVEAERPSVAIIGGSAGLDRGLQRQA